MHFRTRVATLIVRDNHLLLVKMVDPKSGYTWWIPPGGRLEDSDSSILDCAVREAKEETGVSVQVSRIAYIGEFIDQASDTHYLELFLWADSCVGEPTLSHLPADEAELDFIKEVAWVSRSQAQGMRIFPDILRGQFWEQTAEGFVSTQYLGRRSSAERLT